MTITAQSADGTQHQFPDGTDPTVIDKVMKNYATTTPQQPTAQPAQAPQQAVPWYTPLTSAPGNAYDVASSLVKGVGGRISDIAQNPMELNPLYAAGSAINKIAQPIIQNPSGVYNAAKQSLSDNFGSPTAAWNTVATHPIDTLLMAAPGLGMAAKGAEAAGMARTASLLGNAANMTNPINLATKPASMIANSAPASLLGTATREALALPSGVGGDALAEAYNAGKTGGQSADLFAGNLRGTIPQESVVQDTKAALAKMSADRSAAYQQGMLGTQANTTQLDYAPIESAMGGLTDSLFHGPVPITDNASLKLAQNVGQKIDEFKQAFPNPTPSDMDRLKVSIDKLAPNFTQNSGDQSRIVSTMYNAVKNQILGADSTYADTMKAYEQSKGLQNDIQQGLGTGDNKDATLRKLQSVFRNNANTNYGSRMNAAQTLQDAGGTPILPQLAGQQLSAMMPRGLSKLIAGGGLLGAAFNPTLAASLLPYLAAASPRLMGEAAFAGGKATGLLGRTASRLPISRTGAMNSLLGARAAQAYGTNQ